MEELGNCMGICCVQRGGSHRAILAHQSAEEKEGECRLRSLKRKVGSNSGYLDAGHQTVCRCVKTNNVRTIRTLVTSSRSMHYTNFYALIIFHLCSLPLASIDYFAVVRKFEARMVGRPSASMVKLKSTLVCDALWTWRRVKSA